VAYLWWGDFSQTSFIVKKSMKREPSILRRREYRLHLILKSSLIGRPLFYIFTCESSYCFQRVLAVAILSVRPSVCHTGGSVKNGASCDYQIFTAAARNYRYAIQIENLVFVYYLSWTPQFLAKLLNRNCYRLSRVSWALAQISCQIRHCTILRDTSMLPVCWIVFISFCCCFSW